MQQTQLMAYLSKVIFLFLVVVNLLLVLEITRHSRGSTAGLDAERSSVALPLLQDPEKREKLLLFVAIFSAPRHVDRRNAVRETWMKICKKSEKVVCWFVTDGQDIKGRPLVDEVRTKLENESKLHGDLLLAQSPGGSNFGRRILWVAQWASERYEFQYFHRVDDDYFICFEKLLLELEFHRPKQKLSWGWLHCSSKGAVAIDEGFVILSQDLVKSILDRINTTLLCHPFGGQNIGIWLNGYPGLQAFGDNKRLFHLSFDSKAVAAKRPEICKTALGIHKSYPEEMKIYWDVYQKEPKNRSYIVPPIVFPCRIPLGLNYKVFSGKWFAEPKLCKDNPIWEKAFKGRKDK